MKNYITYQVDSFTKEKFKGNPAGVVLNAGGLNDEQMLLIARELNNSETAFLFPPGTDDCDGVKRYFTPKAEVPICGHATIAAMYAKALEENLDSCILKIKTRVGTLPFEIIRSDNDYQVIMTQGPFELSPALAENHTNQLLQYLGLERNDLDERCSVQIASTGHSKVMIGINSRRKLNSLSPDFNSLISLSKTVGCNGYFVFTFDTAGEDVLTCGRMFAPAIGINEDPVTGNANGPLGGYLILNRIIEPSGSCFEFSAMQGEAINRPGIIKVMVIIESGRPSLIQIKGNAVVVFRTEMQMKEGERV